MLSSTCHQFCVNELLQKLPTGLDIFYIGKTQTGKPGSGHSQDRELATPSTAQKTHLVHPFDDSYGVSQLLVVAFSYDILILQTKNQNKENHDVFPNIIFTPTAREELSRKPSLELSQSLKNFIFKSYLLCYSYYNAFQFYLHLTKSNSGPIWMK